MFTHISWNTHKNVWKKNGRTNSSKLGHDSHAFGLLQPHLHDLYTTKLLKKFRQSFMINLLTPDDDYSGRTVPLTSKCCILYIYSTNIDTEYFKHGINSPFFFASKCILFHKSNIFGSCFIHILYTECAKI